MSASNPARSDALVFFGATGDLAYKKIFPALYAMTRRGALDIPVIGVARRPWSVEQLRERARDSIQTYGGGIDSSEAMDSLLSRLRYVHGDYAAPETLGQLRNAVEKPSDG